MICRKHWHHNVILYLYYTMQNEKQNGKASSLFKPSIFPSSHSNAIGEEGPVNITLPEEKDNGMYLLLLLFCLRE